MTAFRRARLQVSRPAATELGAGAVVLVELEHATHDAFEEGPVVAHDDDTARELVEKPLEPREAGEVEVVRRFVEEEDVESADQNRGE